jgi:release factor glutamine methyltransferase
VADPVAAGAATVAEVIDRVVAQLVPRGDLADPRREARWLVADLLARPRTWPAAHPTARLEAAQVARIEAAAARLAGGEPLAYVVGQAGFRHLTLAVDGRVLIPRPETEQLVDLVLERLEPAPGAVVADVGTGSGAIALALASERPTLGEVVATDVSTDALAVAAANLARMGDGPRAPVTLRAGAGLAPLAPWGGRLAAIVSNPPYIPTGAVAALPDAVRRWEPPVALQAGPDGLAVARGLIMGAPGLLAPGGWLALELDSTHLEQAAGIAQATGGYLSVSVVRDLFGRDRFLLAQRRAVSS